MAHPNDLRYYGIHLVNGEQRARWDALVRLQVLPSRYPKKAALRELGIMESFRHLCRLGGLTTMFTGKWPSFRHLTLEFLSTLHVVKSFHPLQIAAIQFRLLNQNYEIYMAELNGILGSTGDEIAEPDEYDKNAFWSAITLPDGGYEQFNPVRAKAKSIRNPVLRFMHKACASLPFARTETGGILAPKLFLLWSVLNGRGLDMAAFVTAHLERQAHKTSGTLCCDGMITTIVLHLEIDVDEWRPDLGKMFLTRSVLSHMHFYKIDSRTQGFFIQVADDHFPIPNPDYTHVNGTQNRDNWRLDTPAHRAIIAASPVRQPWQTYYDPRLPFRAPEFEIPDVLVNHGAPVHRGEPSTRRRRRREEDHGARLDTLETRLDAIGAAVHTGFDHMNSRMDTFEGRVYSWMDDMSQRFQSWHPYPPPPPPP